MLAVSSTRLSGISFRPQVLFLFAFIFMASLAVEAIQSQIGRSFSLEDVGNNLLGCALACFFLLPKRHAVPPARRKVVQTLLALVLISIVFPLMTAIYDELAAYRGFPVLADFEQPFELDRWTATAAIAIDRRVKKSGRASLRVEFDTRQYSTATLRFFPRDWRGYRRLCFDAYNPDGRPLKFVCRVNDKTHADRGNRYDDRFNRGLTLGPGPAWYTFTLDVDEIRRSPVGRDMDLKRVDNMAFFSVSLPEPRTLFLDNVKLMP